MTISFRSLGLAAVVAVAAGCGHEQTLHAPPAPREISADAVGHFCGMLLLEHPGPKGQIFLADQPEPVWFASVSQTFAFTMLDEEPKNIAAIYVTDMGRAASWEKPGPGIWIEARQAVYVIEGRLRGGMGGNEAVPFADSQQAKRFAAENGGRIVSFDSMPRAYVLQQSGSSPAIEAGESARKARGP
jgi:copper chaperone NosL